MMETKDSIIEVIVERSFFVAGVPQPKGSQISLPAPVAWGVLHSGKAQRVKKAEPPSAAPETAQTPEAAQPAEAETPETRGRRRGASRLEED